MIGVTKMMLSEILFEIAKYSLALIMFIIGTHFFILSYKQLKKANSINKKVD